MPAAAGAQITVAGSAAVGVARRLAHLHVVTAEGDAVARLGSAPDGPRIVLTALYRPAITLHCNIAPREIPDADAAI